MPRSCRDMDLLGWKPLLHPERPLYFFHEETVGVCPAFVRPHMFLTFHKRTYTATYLYSQECLEKVNFFLEKIELVKQVYASEMPEDVECVLHLGRDEDDDTVYECYYYLVDHANRV
jgi:hypothetical protein